MSIAEEKRWLRRKILSSQSSQYGLLINESSIEDLKQIILHSPVVGFYMPLPGEINLQILYEFAWQQGCTVLLPKITNNVDMNFFLFDPNTKLALSLYGILEPVSDLFRGSIDLLFVPALGLDKFGNRLGRGQGFYDRFFSEYPSILKVGVSNCLFDLIPTEFNDVCMDYILTSQVFVQVKR